jgi:hypothetical protein
VCYGWRVHDPHLHPSRSAAPQERFRAVLDNSPAAPRTTKTQEVVTRLPYPCAVGVKAKTSAGAEVSEQLSCPAGAPRWMKMVLSSLTPHPGSRIPPAGLAMRSSKCWCREPDEPLDPDTCRHQGLLPPSDREESTHCRVAIAGYPASPLPREVRHGRDLHPLCGVGCA